MSETDLIRTTTVFRKDIGRKEIVEVINIRGRKGKGSQSRIWHNLSTTGSNRPFAMHIRLRIRPSLGKDNRRTLDGKLNLNFSGSRRRSSRFRAPRSQSSLARFPPVRLVSVKRWVVVVRKRRGEMIRSSREGKDKGNSITRYTHKRPVRRDSRKEESV